MNTKLVDLEVKPAKKGTYGVGENAVVSLTISILRSLPFFQSLQSKNAYIHRLRSANNHWHGGKLSHTSAQMLCGNSMFIGNGKGRLLAEIPDDSVLCATCEGRAIGMGMDNGMINGRKVKYKPHKL